MRLASRLAVAAALLATLAVAAITLDVVLGRGRLLAAAFGHAGLADMCRGPLEARLRADGFEPADIELGATPDVTVTLAAGRMLADTFTFADGPAQARVDGVMACSVRLGVVRLDVRTSAGPVRAG